MTHPLVVQLRFTRREWLRGLRHLTPEDAAQRFEPINTYAACDGELDASAVEIMIGGRVVEVCCDDCAVRLKEAHASASASGRD